MSASVGRRPARHAFCLSAFAMPPSHDTPEFSRPPGGEPLIPILPVEDGLGDPVALATWHEALSSTLSVEVPHDLLALWLFPSDGDVVLLGPAALDADHLRVPVPSPHLRMAELTALEEIVSKAGYGSVICLPIRFGRRDAGLLLAADLRADRFGPTEQAILYRTTQRLAPTFGRLARLWAAGDLPTHHGERLLALIEALGAVSRERESPRRFAEALSRALEPLIPHDQLELLLQSPDGDRWFRLGEHAAGRLWADPALVIERKTLDIESLFDATERMVVADTYADRRWPRGFLTAAEPAGAELRSLVGVRLPIMGGVRACLLLGSVGADFYSESEAALLEKAAGLLSPQVEEFARADLSSPERQLGRHPLAAAAELLATTADPVEAIRVASEEARLLIPFRVIHYALRLTDSDRVVLFEPGEHRPLSDLPLVPIAGTSLGALLRGEIPLLHETSQGVTRLAVPLRVAGKIHGAVVLTTPRADIFDAGSATAAQRFADLVAPHVELLRRAALLPPPYVPGWKRSLG
jgi:hypothetical protein